MFDPKEAHTCSISTQTADPIHKQQKEDAESYRLETEGAPSSWGVLLQYPLNFSSIPTTQKGLSVQLPALQQAVS